jgi:hypothetical protein
LTADEFEEAERNVEVMACKDHLADLRRAYPDGIPGELRMKPAPRGRFSPEPAGVLVSPALLCSLTGDVA